MQWPNRVGFVFTLFSEFEIKRNKNVGSVAITLTTKRTTIPLLVYNTAKVTRSLKSTFCRDSESVDNSKIFPSHFNGIGHIKEFLTLRYFGPLWIPHLLFDAESEKHTVFCPNSKLQL